MAGRKKQALDRDVPSSYFFLVLTTHSNPATSNDLFESILAKKQVVYFWRRRFFVVQKNHGSDKESQLKRCGRENNEVIVIDRPHKCRPSYPEDDLLEAGQTNLCESQLLHSSGEMKEE